MATEKDPAETAGSRLALLISLAGLAAVGGAALGRVFQGPGTAFRLAASAAVAVILAGVMERRHVLLGTLVTALGLTVAVGLLVFPSTTRWWLPTLGTLRATGDALRAVGRTADATVAPVLPLPPLVLAALVSVWTAAFSSHALAARARSPFLALLPPAALLSFASLILHDGPRPPYVLAFVASTLGVLFADGVWRVRQWGPATGWRGRKAPALATRPGLRSARRVGVLCLGVALFAPWILPGFRAAGVVRTTGGNFGVGISVDPIVDIRPQLLHNPATELFTVRSTSAAYWQFLSLDTFDGERWTASNEDAAGGSTFLVGPLPAGPPRGPTALIRQRFTLDALRTAFLPAAFQPVFVSMPGAVRYEPQSALLLAPNGTGHGFSYAVTSRLAKPSPTELDGVTSLGGAGYERYTALPSTTPSRLSAIAHSVADREVTPYRKVLAIQDYLRLRFRYSLRVAPGQGNQLLYFLTRSRTGYCEQFAGAMAAMLRAIGIPARVAVGYTPGTPDRRDPHLFHVTTADAHAWVEVPFPGYGWLSFEPTPTRLNPVARDYSFPPLTGGNVAPECIVRGFDQCVAPGGTTGAGSVSDRRLGDTGGDVPSAPTAPLGGTARPRGHPAWRRLAWLELLSLAVLAIGLVALIKVVARRLAVARAREPRELVLAAYSRLAGEAADVGLARRPSETLWEYHARLNDRVAFSDGDLRRLFGLTGRAAYSERGISEDQALLAVAAGRRAEREIKGSVGLARRLAGAVRVGHGPAGPVLATRKATRASRSSSTTSATIRTLRSRRFR